MKVKAEPLRDFFKSNGLFDSMLRKHREINVNIDANKYKVSINSDSPQSLVASLSILAQKIAKNEYRSNLGLLTYKSEAASYYWIVFSAKAFLLPFINPTNGNGVVFLSSANSGSKSRLYIGNQEAIVTIPKTQRKVNLDAYAVFDLSVPANNSMPQIFFDGSLDVELSVNLGKDFSAVSPAQCLQLEKGTTRIVVKVKGSSSKIVSDAVVRFIWPVIRFDLDSNTAQEKPLEVNHLGNKYTLIGTAFDWQGGLGATQIDSKISKV